ncbi:unnamed protein product [Schistosoma margrebowiei]|uniref:Uncharacterized protein n=1 Tax=Schistosoma margrebowiei TaxID=48269 RepID=A0AA85AHV0_9TREM|nr:unnamed protein product [Schistosoma margrebowiei]
MLIVQLILTDNNVKRVLFLRLVSDEIHNKISVFNNFENQLHLHCNHLHKLLSVNDLAVNESDTNAGINAFNDPGDIDDISPVLDSETLCTVFIKLKQMYEGNCMNNSSVAVGENDVNSEFDQMSFINRPGQNDVTDNHDNVPGVTEDISPEFQRQRKCSFIYEFFHPHIQDCMNNSSVDRPYENGN